MIASPRAASNTTYTVHFYRIGTKTQKIRDLSGTFKGWEALQTEIRTYMQRWLKSDAESVDIGVYHEPGDVASSLTFADGRYGTAEVHFSKGV